MHDDVERITLLDLLALAKPGAPGPRGAEGPQGIPGPVSAAALAGLLINEDLTSQVDGVRTVFDVLVSGVATPFNAAASLVFLGLDITHAVVMNGPGAQFTITPAIGVSDVGDSALRFIGVKA